MEKKRRPSKTSNERTTSEFVAIDEFFALESAPPPPLLDELEIRAGIFPHPDELTDDALPAMLWRMLRALACMRTFILHTDHLTDRELYVRLCDHAIPCFARVIRHDAREQPFAAGRKSPFIARVPRAGARGMR